MLEWDYCHEKARVPTYFCQKVAISCAKPGCVLSAMPVSVHSCESAAGVALWPGVEHVLNSIGGGSGWPLRFVARLRDPSAGKDGVGSVA
jgi:hypothetical protein